MAGDNDERAPRQEMSPLAPKALRTVVGALVGSFVGLLMGYLLGMAYVVLFDVSSFEGYSAYVVGYCFMLPGVPIGALLGGFLAFKGLPWLHRKWSQGRVSRTD